jgi:hypothetical protein
VRYATRLVGFEPVTGGPAPHFRLHPEVDGAQRFEATRKLIFANGVSGSGAPYVPELLGGRGGSRPRGPGRTPVRTP